jgi:hypothetical protein
MLTSLLASTHTNILHYIFIFPASFLVVLCVCVNEGMEMYIHLGVNKVYLWAGVAINFN